MRRSVICIAFAACAFFCASDSHARRRGAIQAVGGTNIPQVGLAIDAGYDSRLDSFLPDYKVINVALFNQSLDIIRLDPQNDMWSITLEGDKRPHKAIFDLRSQDPKSWSQVPERAQGLVAYPLVLPIGAREVIDLFVPASLDLERFKILNIYLRSIDTKIEILVRQ